MADETFRWNWRGWARSSEGYAVRLLGRTNLQYIDEYGDLHISAEVMSKPANEIVVYTSTIPDRPERPRDEVVSRLRRAFDYKDWTMVVEDGSNARSYAADSETRPADRASGSIGKAEPTGSAPVP